MSTFTLSFTLASDTLFGRGDGVAGMVDQEVQHDNYGCPYLGGKTLKGILVNECADLLEALPTNKRSRWQQVARQLFGEPGGLYEQASRMQVSDACLPDDVRAAVVQAVESKKLRRNDVLDSLTTLRRQTAMDPTTGVPLQHSLRTMRVILRNTTFVASLRLQDDADNADARRLLAACSAALRRVGTARNRGHGRLMEVTLADEHGVLLSTSAFEEFCQEVLA